MGDSKKNCSGVQICDGKISSDEFLHDVSSIPSTSASSDVLPLLNLENDNKDSVGKDKNLTRKEVFDLESVKKSIIISCAKERTIPFVVEGGSENSLLIYIGQVLRVDLLDQLGYGDVIFSIDNIKIAGRVLSEVSAFLYTLFNSSDDITLEYIPAGIIPIDMKEILRNLHWEQLQFIVRNNVFLRVVPCTTREPNPEEISGENYHFVSLRHFLKLLRRGVFLEHASFEGHLNGTPRPEVDIREHDTVNAKNILIESLICKEEGKEREELIDGVSLTDLSTKMVQADSRGPLPPNWEVAYSENGEKYFIDHNTGTTQWEDPRDDANSDAKSVYTVSDTSTPTTIAAAPSAAVPTAKGGLTDKKLPPGWERVDDEVHGTFYVDHINKRTQYEPPPQSSLRTEAILSPGIKPVINDMHDRATQSNNRCNSYYQPQIRPEQINGVAESTSLVTNNDTTGYNFLQRRDLRKACGNINNNGDSSHFLMNGDHSQQNGTFYLDESLPGRASHTDSTAVWKRGQIAPLLQNGHDMIDGGFVNNNNGTVKISDYSLQNGSIYGVVNRAGKQQRAAIPYVFTNNVNQLRGELLTTVIQKGTNGLGFTLIGNDGSSAEPEFIQIKTILPNGPAARNGVLEPGDILVYVNNELMLGASQEDACCTFRSILPGQSVHVQVCRGYPYPASKIYTVSTNFQNHSRENIEIDLRKSSNGFGFTITDSLQGQRVKTVLYPEQCPNLMEGDIILEVNGQNVRSIAHAKLVETLKNFLPGSRLRMLISRNTSRHRSRTPTAGFRYGEQRQTPVNAAPRSKTPAPISSNVSRINGANAAAINRNNLFQKQQQRALNYESIANWSTTMPKAQNQPRTDGQPIYGDIHKYQQNNDIPSPIRNSSSSLGFSSTPNYMPASVLGNQHSQPEQNHSEWQFITVNLIEKDSGFGFHLQSDEQNSPLIVGPIIPGGAARLDGRLQPGDEIIEIDGQPATHFNYSTAVSAIRAATSVGHVKLVVKRKREVNIYAVHNTSPSVIATNFSNAFGDNGTLQHVNASRSAKNQQLPYDVHLAKLEYEDFGITIISQNHRYIGTISAQSPAAKCGRLKAGDCITAINGLSVFNMTHQQVVNFMRSSGNAITLTIDPNSRMTLVPTPTLHANQHNSVGPVGSGSDEIDSLVSMMATATNGTLKSNVSYGTITKNNGVVLSTNGGDINETYKETLLSVSLQRGTKGFGFSIRGGMEFSEMPLFILRIADDGPAAINGRLRVGDQLVQINGENTVGMTHSRAIELITRDTVVHLVVMRKN